MLTTCPECTTTFRVSQEHLGLRRGLVRCGHCGVVFNAYDSLLADLRPSPEAEKAAQKVESVEDSSLPPFPELPPVAPPPAPAVKRSVAPAHEAPPVVKVKIPPVEATPVEAPLIESPVAKPSPAEAEPPPLVIRPAQKPIRRQPEASAPPPAAKGRWRLPVQILGAIVLLTLLLAQSAFFLRAEFAAAYPALRPPLQAACQPLGCEVPLPKQLDKTAIAASSLEHDGENKTRTRLAMLLANRTGQAQTWPYVILILTDLKDMPVAQKVFSPHDYLPKDAPFDAGFAADEEQEIRLDLDTGPLSATGYALDLAYP